jgi:hypothetical protein
MKLDPGMHIGLHFVFFGKTGVKMLVHGVCMLEFKFEFEFHLFESLTK